MKAIRFVPLHNKEAFSQIKFRSSCMKEIALYKTVVQNHLQIVHFETQGRYEISVGKVLDRLRCWVLAWLVSTDVTDVNIMHRIWFYFKC
jgi:hypothetical protein